MDRIQLPKETFAKVVEVAESNEPPTPAMLGLMQGDYVETALRLENQRVIPARSKCLACGDYHEGSGNLPCPKMSPYSTINQQGHYSDCATNNRGVPELLGPCDCGYEGDAK